jgi:hypothetical protein
MGIVIGCDFHGRFQLLVVYDEGAESRGEVRLEREDRDLVEGFYRGLPPGALVD